MSDWPRPIPREPTPLDLGNAILEALAVIPQGWTRPSCTPTRDGWRVESLLLNLASRRFSVRGSISATNQSMERAYLEFADKMREIHA